MVKLLYNVLYGQIDSPYLLSEIHISAPTRASKPEKLFSISRARTNILPNSPLEKNVKLYNRLVRINSDIDMFFDRKYNIERR